MVIRQGDVFWIELEPAAGSEPGYSHPHVVVQNDVFTQSRLGTVVVCALTSNLRRANQPGNVLLESGEANLPKPSVVNVTQILTVDRRDLGDRIGSLSPRRVREVIAGIKLVIEPRDVQSA